MSIIESIQKARERGVGDDKILREVIKQNPGKDKIFIAALESGEKPSQIIDGIVKEQEKKEEELRIQIAKKRIEELKKRSGKTEPVRTSPPPIDRTPLEEDKEEIPEEIKPPVEKPPEIKVKRKLPTSSYSRPTAPFPPSPSAAQKPVEVIRPLPQKPSTKQKLWIRVSIFSLALVLLAGIGTFWYWYFFRPPIITGCTTNQDCSLGFFCNVNKVCEQMTEKCEDNSDCPEKHICGPEKKCIEAPTEIAIPEPLFAVESTRPLEISKIDDLRPLLTQIIKEDQNINEFKRVIIKNTADKKFLDLRDFINAVQMRIPDELYQKVKEDEFMLFIYSQTYGTRLGFAVKIKEKQGLEDLLKSKEKTMKDDFKTFFTLMVEESVYNQKPLSSTFKDSSQYLGYEGPNFRYQTLNRNDLGIIYLVSDDYFVFTSSWESMTKTITKLNIKPPLVLLTKDLKIGMRDNEVKILQTFLAKDPLIYPEKTISGYFGSLTKRAVVRFQEKYANELLAPRNLTKGDGIVELLTRTKINGFLSAPQ